MLLSSPVGGRVAPARRLGTVLAAGALLFPVAPGSTSAAVPVAPKPAAAMPAAPPVPGQAELAALRAQAAKTRELLIQGTKEYEAGQVELAQARAAATASRLAADAAARASQQTKEALDEYAAAAYRNPIPLDLEMMLSFDGDVGALLASPSWVAEAGEEYSGQLDNAVANQQRATELSRRAEEMAAAADAATKAQAVRLTQLRLQSQRSVAQLNAAMKAVEEARIRAAKAAAAAAARKAAAEAARRAQQRGSRAGGPSTFRIAGGSCSAGDFGRGGGSWGGYENGLIPASALCPVAGASGEYLRADAANAFRELTAAYARRFGRPISVTDAYRSYAEQVRLFAIKPNLAAVPGFSNHGWGLALDLGGGINRFGTAEHEWMRANAPRYGWVHPLWARANGSKPEAWHWEYGRL